MARTIITADWHLTDKTKDEYRWKSVEWILQLCRERRANLVVLGDLTDQKDHHCARFVARLVDLLSSASERGTGVSVLMGNHDYSQRGYPFFGFLNKISASELRVSRNLHYYDKPAFTRYPSSVCWLPYQPAEAWHAAFEQKVIQKNLEKAEMLCIHQPVTGAILESGGKYQGGGISSKVFDALPKSVSVFAGDLHVPQTIGRVTYCGSPHPLRFGDQFSPRVLYRHDDGELENVSVPGIRKVSVTSKGLPDLKNQLSELSRGDHVRVTLQLPTGQSGGDLRRYQSEAADLAQSAGVLLACVSLQPKSPRKRLRKEVVAATQSSPLSLLEGYCTNQGLSDEVTQAGLNLLQEFEA